ncbi:MAG: hypothetical protein ABSB76_27910 [Streptosporangiaceae bacterium]
MLPRHTRTRYPAVASSVTAPPGSQDGLRRRALAATRATLRDRARRQNINMSERTVVLRPPSPLVVLPEP